MPIIHLSSLSHLNDILDKSKNGKLTVIDFHATWCGPCHAIAPTYEKLSKEYTNTNFLKCDVDEVKEVAIEYKVTTMPTFIFIKQGQQVARVKGANRALLESTLKAQVGPSGPAIFAGQGQTLDSSSPSPHRPSTANPGHSGSGVIETWSHLDPQVKIFVGLIAAYVVFWWLG